MITTPNQLTSQILLESVGNLRGAGEDGQNQELGKTIYNRLRNLFFKNLTIFMLLVLLLVILSIELCTF